MREHMRKHHTDPRKYLNEYTSYQMGVESEKAMTISEAIREISGELPRYAVAVRGLRRREGLTQAEMGKMLGIPQANISQMEHGRRPIGKQIAKRLAELFNTDYRLFL